METLSELLVQLQKARADKSAMRFTDKEWEMFFNWLTRKYGISEDSYYEQDDEFCDKVEREWAEIYESYGNTLGAK